MIVINSAPKSVDFCGNGLPFNIDSSNAFSVNGSTSEMILIVNSAVTLGNIFNFTLANEVIEFNVLSIWNESGNIITAGSTAREITDALNKNYQLQKNFIITYNLNKITLLAKLPGAYSNLLFFSNTPAITLFHNITGVDKTIRKGYKTLCDIYLEIEKGTNIFQNIATSLYNIDVIGRCIVKPGRIISKYFTDVDLPTYNQSAILKVNRTVKRYYLKLAEIFEGKVRDVKTSSTLNAIDGRFDSETNSFDYLTYVATAKSYLMEPSFEKIETWITAQQFLYFEGRILVRCFW